MLKFENLPYSVRQAAVLSVGWRNSWYRYGAEYKKWSNIIQTTRQYNVESQISWQVEQLYTLLKTAKSGSEYYRDTLPELKCPQNNTDLGELLSDIPHLQKDVIRQLTSSLKNRNVTGITKSSTSGSTGAPMTVEHDVGSIQRRFAFIHDHIRMGGDEPFGPSVRLSGRIICKAGVPQKKPWLFNRAENQLLLSTYHLDKKHEFAIGRRVQHLNPTRLDGYPSGILELLRLLHRNNLVLPNLKTIITTAETLHQEVREEIENLSSVPVLDYYSASEGVPFIHQCAFGTYHVRWESGIFEVESNNITDFEGDGQLVCTSFVQNRMPLIRYRTGDMVENLRTRDQLVCLCGMQTPTVRQVSGRIEDLIHTKDGRALGMFTYRTLKHIQGIGETQVIQHNYTDFEVRTDIFSMVDRDALYFEIKDSFERVIGYPITLRLSEVEKPARGPNGKVRLVISNVNDEEGKVD